MKFLDLSFHGSYFNLTGEEYLQKAASNIRYANYLKDTYSIKFIFHSGRNEILSKNGIDYCFKKKKRNSKIFFSIKLGFEIRKYKPDIILIHSIYYSHFAAILRQFLPSKTLILIQNHAERVPPSWIKKWILRISDTYIDGYFFVSKEMTKPWLENKIFSSEDKIFEMMEGSTGFLKKDKKLCREKLELPLNEKIFIWVGRLDSNKDPLCALNAFKILNDKGYMFKLFMFYHTEELLESIKKFISMHQLEDKIILKGKIEHNKLESWYSASDFFISASHNEGSGYALCEAMACGCIPIITDIPSFKYMTNEGKAGFLYSRGDYDNLSKMIEKAFEIDLEEKANEVLNVFNERLSYKAIAHNLHEAISYYKR